MTAREPVAGRVLCRAHSAVGVDVVPPDPLESLPVLADELSCESGTAPYLRPATADSGRSRVKRANTTPPQGEDAHHREGKAI
jgi:hypothetical protein